MPPLLFLFLCALLGTRVVLSLDTNSFKFTIASVKQCEPVFLNFTGQNPQAGAPVSLKILPFNSTAINIPVPAVNVTDKGVNVSFLPLPQDSTFIASLNDNTGENTSKVSDVTRVQAGTSSDCVQPASNATRLFALDGVDDPTRQPRQCEDFTVKYNASVTGAPDVRIYSPLSAAYALNKTSDDGIGTAKYTLVAGRFAQYVLLFENSMGVMETTPLLTVGGDSGSSKACFGDLSSLSSNGSSSQNGGGLPQKTIIGLAIGGGIVAIIALCMVAFLVWERRRRRRVSIRFDPTMMEKRRESTTRATISPRPTRNSFYTEYSAAGAGFVKNPPYTASIHPRQGISTRSSLQSWAQSVPSDQMSINRAVQQAGRRVSTDSSVHSFDDIEKILNSQEQQLQFSQDSVLPSDRPLSALSTESSVVTAPTLAVRAVPSRGHLRDPSDIPRAPSDLSQSDSLLAPFEMVTPKPPYAQNKSHFSEVSATSSFGFGRDSRISGIPASVSADDVDEIPEVPRRPLPTPGGLGRGYGDAR